jgi:hypothetical protein
VIDALLGALAIQLEIKPDLEAARRMEHRWQKRQERQVREPARLSKELLAIAKPIILRELTRNATIASAVARRRRAKHTGNGHAAER